MSVARRLDGEHVESRTGDQSLVERLDKRGFVDEPPRAVLMSSALRFILRKAARSIRFRVAGMRGNGARSRRIPPAPRRAP